MSHKSCDLFTKLYQVTIFTLTITFHVYIGLLTIVLLLHCRDLSSGGLISISFYLVFLHLFVDPKFQIRTNKRNRGKRSLEDSPEVHHIKLCGLQWNNIM